MKDKTLEVLSLNNDLTAKKKNLCYFHSLSLSAARKKNNLIRLPPDMTAT